MRKNQRQAAPQDYGKSSWYHSRLLSALVGAAVGLTGTLTVINSNTGISVENLLMKRENMLSNRVIADHELQAKVFDIYVQHVVPALDKDVEDHQKVALLAGLHSNFSSFFDTRPVFEAFAQKVEDPIARLELRRVAKRVARHQSRFITGKGGGGSEINLRWDDSGSDRDSSWCWGDSTSPKALKVRLRLKEEPIRHYSKDASRTLSIQFPALADDGDELIDDVSDFVTVEVVFEESEGKGNKMTMDTVTIELSYMDTPYMDNFGMRHGDMPEHQMSLRLRDIDTEFGVDPDTVHRVKIEILSFKGDIYAAPQRLDSK